MHTHSANSNDHDIVSVSVLCYPGQRLALHYSLDEYWRTIGDTGDPGDCQCVSHHSVKNRLHILTELHFWEVYKEKG